jgi:hypothetical protein
MKYKLDAIIFECKTHSLRITKALKNVEEMFPLSPKNYTALNDESIEHIDQLVYRFTKLQDALGAKLFPLVVSFLREDSRTLTIIDVLNELEKREIIHSAEEWMALREIRNQIAHDYENDPENGSYYLNAIFTQATDLVRIAEEVIDFSQNRILPVLKDE